MIVDKFLHELKHCAPHNLLFKKEDLYVYAFDTSQNPAKTILPLAVVFPRNTEEVSKIVKVCSKYNISIVPRAQGTNHCGATRPTKNSIVVHFSYLPPSYQIAEVHRSQLNTKKEKQ